VAHIAFIGLGKMGRPMATTLVRAGYGVRGFDLLPILCDEAAKDGVSIANSAKEALEGANVVITVLPGGQHVLSVWVDLLPHAGKGTLFIDSSTIDVDSARRIHELAAKAGMLSVDAPVSGGTAGAKAGTLTFICGAAEATFVAAKPILEKMGRKIILCGGAGAPIRLCLTWSPRPRVNHGRSQTIARSRAWCLAHPPTTAISRGSRRRSC
jgi:3-hydroxyisobutyrate dehydrogenase